MIGVQNRDLKSHTVKLAMSPELHKMIPENIASYSVGGIVSSGDVQRIKNAGFQGVLMGEHLMTAENPVEEFTRIIGESGENLNGQK